MLTAREEQVVALAADGLSNRGMARELRPSEHSIKKYLFPDFRQARSFVAGRTAAPMP
jgi:ATP/maltotriose-dependent transcriptional regulator MalT